MRQQRIFRDLARYYDDLYAAKDYRGEAARIRRIVERARGAAGGSLLDVACGTGGHLRHLARTFLAEGMDRNEGMLAVARAKLPDLAFHRADMAELAMGRRFDAIVCLYSSIAYVRTELRLARTLGGFARHLAPGGVVVIEPWFTPGRFRPGESTRTFRTADGVVIERRGRARRVGGLSVLDFELRIRVPGRPVRTVRDRHELALFETGRTLELMRAAGLEARFLARGLLENRGLLVGLKP